MTFWLDNWIWVKLQTLYLTCNCNLVNPIYCLLSADEKFDGTYPTNVVVTDGGNCTYIPPGIFKSTCQGQNRGTNVGSHHFLMFWINQKLDLEAFEHIPQIPDFRSTSHGSHSTTRTATWSSGAGPTMDLRQGKFYLEEQHSFDEDIEFWKAMWIWLLLILEFSPDKNLHTQKTVSKLFFFTLSFETRMRIKLLHTPNTDSLISVGRSFYWLVCSGIRNVRPHSGTGYICVNNINCRFCFGLKVFSSCRTRELLQFWKTTYFVRGCGAVLWRFVQLDLVLQSEEGADTSGFVMNGEWALLGVPAVRQTHQHLA